MFTGQVVNSPASVSSSLKDITALFHRLLGELNELICVKCLGQSLEDSTHYMLQECCLFLYLEKGGGGGGLGVGEKKPNIVKHCVPETAKA